MASVAEPFLGYARKDRYQRFLSKIFFKYSPV